MNSRFAVAVHILAYLEYVQGRPATSEEIATSVNTNPVVVRRLLSILRQAGLTKTQFGVGGGAFLARPGSKIALLDVYEATEENADLFSLNRLNPRTDCDVGAHLQVTLEKIFGEAEQALKQALEKVTIEEVLREAQAKSNRNKQ
ncbi:Rrf2 family protein [Hyella patelloides LEGE 07179]|uniref:Rrf2 family protein n=1 Tax=Hyella patelloides LEGE 07179 TaxID=945734 RepID=A0A563W1A7_9CYAN|nr:Rrf2 family transcriptional regulator [Hyella patelloides]VEP17415.1 Rrf2 family protein [Hyella patelloides LEGE 07179]